MESQYIDENAQDYDTNQMYAQDEMAQSQMQNFADQYTDDGDESFDPAQFFIQNSGLANQNQTSSDVKEEETEVAMETSMDDLHVSRSDDEDNSKNMERQYNDGEESQSHEPFDFEEFFIS